MSVRNRVLKLTRLAQSERIRQHPFSFVKWAWQTFRMQSKVSRSPIHLHIEPTTRCNLQCSMCEHTYWKEQKIDIDLEKFKHIVDSVPGVASIDLTGIGEGLLNPEFAKILEEAKMRKLRVRFNTNGTLIDKTWAQRLVALGIDEVHFSIDGGQAETFENIRVGAKFTEVLSALSLIAEAKALLNERLPEVHVICIALKETIPEIPMLIDAVAQRGASYVDIQGLIEFDDNQAHTLEGMDTESLKTHFDAARKMAKAKGIKLALPSIEPKETPCYHPWFQSYVLADGTVLPCCLYGQRNNRDELRNDLAFGNIFKQKFDDIWNNGSYRDIRSMLKSKQLKGICAKCPIPKGQF